MKKRKNSSNSAELKRSQCPIANALDVLGDKWTLLVVRDLLFKGKRLYSEFQDSSEGIPTNILAERLKRLQQAGIITKTPYQENPVRYAYALTPKGSQLQPVLVEMIRWATQHIPGTYQAPKGFFDNPEKFINSLKAENSKNK